MRPVNGLLEIVLLILSLAFASTQDPNPAENALHVGVYILYDRKIYNQIRNPYGYDRDGLPSTPEGYFSAFLKSVEWRFRNISDISLSVSLVKTSLLDDDKVPEIEVPAHGYSDTINGSETLQKLGKLVSENTDTYNGDAVFLVTTQYIWTKETGENWIGLAKKGAICDPLGKVGVVTDNGQTFRGVQETALQVALLLGASKDGNGNNCSDKENYLLSNIFAGNLPALSTCSKEDIVKFVLKKKDEGGNCFKTVQNDILRKQSVMPFRYHNLTGYDLCTAGRSDRYRDVATCRPGDGRVGFNRTCQVQCCEYNSPYTRNFRSLSLGGRWVADGTSCGDGRVCIYGKCEPQQPQLL